MKILWISRWDSRRPADGQLLYSEGLISSLEALGADITTLATARADGGSMEPSPGRTILPPARSPRPLSLLSANTADAFKQATGAFAAAVDQALGQNPTVVIFDYYATGWALDTVRKHCAAMGAKRPLVVYLSHNHEASIRRDVANGYQGNPLMRAIVRHDAKKAAVMENALVAAADVVATNTDEDAALYRSAAPNKRFITVTPAYSGAQRAAGAITTTTSRRVIMMGSLLWIAKQENLRRFITAAHGRFLAANIELYVLGRSDPAFLRSIERQSSVVRALGFIDDPLPYLYDSRVGLMPDELGGGFKHRIVNYVFNGVPVAAIRSQAAGLPLDFDHDIIAGDNVNELVDGIIAVFDDIERLNAMATRALDKCRNKFDWQSRGQLLLDTIADAHRHLVD